MRLVGATVLTPGANQLFGVWVLSCIAIFANVLFAVCSQSPHDYPLAQYKGGLGSPQHEFRHYRWNHLTYRPGAFRRRAGPFGI
ncbi:hypothetical protein BIW11_13082, partial [Tropilaelaps mercedesae]